jgi:hypothetical protein
MHFYIEGQEGWEEITRELAEHPRLLRNYCSESTTTATIQYRREGRCRINTHQFKNRFVDFQRQAVPMSG